MKTMKRLVVAILCVATLISCLALASCGQCKHSYGEWSVAKEATCSVKGTEVRVCGECGATEERDIAVLGHTYGEWVEVEGSTCLAGSKERVCSVCGHKDTSNEAAGHVGGIICDVCGEAVIDINDIPVIEFAPESSLAVVLKDLEISAVDEHYPTDSGDYTLDIAELVLSLDENDDIVGYGHGTLKAAAKNTDIRNELSVVVYVDGGALYVYVDGTPVLDSDEQTKGYVKIDIANLAEIALATEEAQQALTMAETMLPVVQTWIEESFLPLFESVEIAVDEAAAEELAYKVLDLFLVPVDVENGTKLELNLDTVKEINETLATKKLSEVVDLVLGDGKYEEIKAAIPSVLNFSVEDLIAWIAEQGVDVDAVLASLDALAAAIIGDEAATFEMLVGLTDIDISEFIKQEEVKKLAVRDALIMMMGAVDDETTADVNEAEVALSEAIASILEMLENKTLYDLLGADETVKDEVNTAIDELTEMISYSVTYTKDGAVSCEVSITVEDAVITYVTTAKNGEITSTVSVAAEGSSAAFTTQIIADYTPTVANEELAITLAEIKAKTDTIVITEENCTVLDINGHEVEPYYDEDGAFVGIVYYENNSYNRYNDETGKYNYVVSEEKTVINLDNVWLCSVVEGCDGYYGVHMIVFADVYRSEAVYDCDENGNPVMDTLLGTSESSVNSLPNIDFGYEYENGRVVEDGGHEYEMDVENSVFGKCEEYDKCVYVCANCGASYVEYYYNDHSFYKESVTESAVTYKCDNDGCDETVVCNVVINSELDIEFIDADSSDAYYKLVVEEDGEYVITVSFDDYAYVNLYFEDTQVDYYQEDDTYFYTLAAGEYELELYATHSVEYDAGDITITIGKQ